MKRTKYIMLVSGSMSNANKWRRVYEENGRYYVKFEGTVKDVTRRKDYFIVE